MLSPKEICAYTEEAGVQKARRSAPVLFVLAMLAGVFIAFAAYGSTMAAFNLLANKETYGLGRFVAGLVFPTGLMLVLLAGGELFTGNTLMIIALVQRRINLMDILRNWIIVYAGNFIGSLFLAYMTVNSGLLQSGANLLGGVTIGIALGKINLPFLSAFYLGIMCNWLVCLAVWLCYGTRGMVGKLAGIFFPICLFITSGFEHSVANMYYIPAGIMAKSNTAFAAAAGLSAEALISLNWKNFFLNNLLPVSLGNILGGAVFVGLAYWFAFLRVTGAK